MSDELSDVLYVKFKELVDAGCLKVIALGSTKALKVGPVLAIELGITSDRLVIVVAEMVKPA